MIKQKKRISVLLLLIMAVMLTACGGKNKGESDSSKEDEGKDSGLKAPYYEQVDAAVQELVKCVTKKKSVEMTIPYEIDKMEIDRVVTEYHSRRASGGNEPYITVLFKCTFANDNGVNQEVYFEYNPVLSSEDKIVLDSTHTVESFFKIVDGENSKYEEIEPGVFAKGVGTDYELRFTEVDIEDYKSKGYTWNK